MDGLTVSELLTLARESGLSINQRTLRLYIDRGLIPKPDVRQREESGRSGYHDPRVVELLTAIDGLQQQGYSLRDIKTILKRLESIARQSGKDPIAAQISGALAISKRTTEMFEKGGAGDAGAIPSASALAVWRSIAGPVVAEMLRRGAVPDTSRIVELRVTATTRDGQTFSAPVFLDPESVVYTNPTRDDDEELDRLTSEYLSELTGKKHPLAGAESIRSWLEETYDMSRENFILAKRSAFAETATGYAIGFVALGVEPERIRAGQVRLEGPYVVPEYRGQGLGRELLNRAESRALSLGAKYIDAFLDSEATPAISFLRHFGFVPDHFIWETRVELPAISSSGEDPLADKSRMRRRLEIRPVASPDELEQSLRLHEEVMKGTPGYYRAKAEDLTSFGVKYPMEHHFNAYLDGELVGTVWNSVPSPRVYAVVLPRYANTWIELALWRHILRYLRSKGLKEARTEAVSELTSGRKALSILGFVPYKMTVCYRKRIDGR